MFRLFAHIDFFLLAHEVGQERQAQQAGVDMEDQISISIILADDSNIPGSPLHDPCDQLETPLEARVPDERKKGK